MSLPQKLLTRKEEITAGFLQLAEQHLTNLLHNRASHLFHASDFAALLFIHPRHLTNTIKLTLGKSPCDVMEERVLVAAQRLLRETEMPVKDIASLFFYYEPGNFIKFFKGMCGTTPLQYRKQLAEPDPVKVMVS